MEPDRPHIDAAIREQAAQWLLRLDEDFGPRQRALFAAWLKQSPRHAEEFLLLTALWRQLDHVDPQRRIDVPALVAEANSRGAPW